MIISLQWNSFSLLNNWHVRFTNIPVSLWISTYFNIQWFTSVRIWLLIFSVCDIPCELCILENTCRHCDDYHYGPNCENNCSAGCLPGSWDEVTGECSACLVGYSGKQCQLKCKRKFILILEHISHIFLYICCFWDLHFTFLLNQKFFNYMTHIK